MSQLFVSYKNVAAGLLITATFFFSSCSTYRVVTKAQAGSELSKPIIAKAYFWGLLQSPKEIDTPICDSLGVNGVSEVVMTRNFGQALATIFSLGIYSPMKVQWKCSKPCKKSGDL